MNSNIKAFKSGIWYTIGNFIAKASAFLTVPIFTRIMSVDDVGRFSNYTSWLGIFMIITTFDLFNSLNIARFDFKDDIDNYIASNLIHGSIITTVFFSIFLSSFSFFGKLFSLELYELFLLYLYCLVYPALQMYQLKCRIDYRYKMSVFLSLFSVFISTFLSLLLVFFMPNKYVGRCMGYTVPIIAINAIVYFRLIAKSKKIFVKRYWKYAMTISFPLVWHTLAGNLLTSSDRVMIKFFFDSESVALYSIAYSCASIVQVLWISMNSAWTPWAMEKINEKKYFVLKRAIKPYCIFFGLVVLIFLLISPEVLYLMGGKAYMSALNVIPPIMVSYVFNFAYSFYVIIEQYEKKQVIIAICTITAAIMNLILNAIFLPIFGYTVAAYTTLIGYIVLFVMHFVSCMKLKKLFIVNNRFVGAFLILFLIVMFLMPLLYQNSILRYIIICSILMICIGIFIILKKDIVYMIRNKSINCIKDKK